MEKEWGTIGVFNRGIEKEWDVEFYLISDSEISPNEYLDALQ